jgi:hemerythrin-like metal-binding protein
MDIFVWNDSFVTGQPVVDTEHQGLVSLINWLIEHQSTSTPPEEVDKVLVQLVEYAVTHFGHEEELMASTGCDPRFIEIHRNVHADFGQQVVRMRDEPAQRHECDVPDDRGAQR